MVEPKIYKVYLPSEREVLRDLTPLFHDGYWLRRNLSRWHRLASGPAALLRIDGRLDANYRIIKGVLEEPGQVKSRRHSMKAALIFQKEDVLKFEAVLGGSLVVEFKGAAGDKVSLGGLSPAHARELAKHWNFMI